MNTYLVNRRKERQKTQKEVAVALNLSERHYQYIEYGTMPRVLLALRIAKFLECSVEDIFKE